MLALTATSSSDSGLSVVVICLVLVLNFIPAFVALNRKHNAIGAIVLSVIIIDVCLIVSAVMSIALLPLASTAGILPVAAMWLGCLVWASNSNTQFHEQRRAKTFAQAMVKSAEEHRQMLQATLVGLDAVAQEMAQ